MLRHVARVRSPFAPRAGRRAALRRSAAAAPRSRARVVLAPLAALAAAASGLLFVVLLPICGIASIAEAVAKACWTFARDAVTGLRRPAHERG